MCKSELPYYCGNNKAEVSEAGIFPDQIYCRCNGYRVKRERERWKSLEYNEKEFGLDIIGKD